MADVYYNQAELIALGTIFPVLTGALVALRFYLRKKRGSGYGVDDWLTLPAYLLHVGICATAIAGAALGGSGTPTPSEVDSLGGNYQRRVAGEVLWAVLIQQPLSLGFVKLSFLYFYRRIFVTAQRSFSRPFDIINTFMIVFTVLWMVAFFIVYIFQCGTNPWGYYGSTRVYEQQNCVKTQMLNNVFAGTDVATDLIIILMPIPFVIRLHMTSQSKIAVIGILSLGGLALATSVIRLAIYILSDAVLYANVDLDELRTGAVFWPTLESGFGMLAACLPVIYRSFKTNELESLINSVRSAVGLRPLPVKPKGSKASRTANSKPMHGDTNSQASSASIIHAETSMDAIQHNEHELLQIGQARGNLFSNRIDTHASTELAPGEHDIVVQRSFTVDHSQV